MRYSRLTAWMVCVLAVLVVIILFNLIFMKWIDAYIAFPNQEQVAYLSQALPVDLVLRNTEEARYSSSYIKLVFDKSFDDYFKIVQTNPPAAVKKKDFRGRTVLKFKDKVVLKFTRSESIRLYLQPIKKGITEIRLSVHALGYPLVRRIPPEKVISEPITILGAPGRIDEPVETIITDETDTQPIDLQTTVAVPNREPSLVDLILQEPIGHLHRSQAADVNATRQQPNPLLELLLNKAREGK